MEITITAVRVAHSAPQDDGLRYIALLSDTRVREIAPTAIEAMRRLLDNHGWQGREVVFIDSRGEREPVGMIEEYAALIGAI